jgi:hypothetical protein
MSAFVELTIICLKSRAENPHCGSRIDANRLGKGALYGNRL